MGVIFCTPPTHPPTICGYCTVGGWVNLLGVGAGKPEAERRAGIFRAQAEPDFCVFRLFRLTPSVLQVVPSCRVPFVHNGTTRLYALMTLRPIFDGCDQNYRQNFERLTVRREAVNFNVTLKLTASLISTYDSNTVVD